MDSGVAGLELSVVIHHMSTLEMTLLHKTCMAVGACKQTRIEQI